MAAFNDAFAAVNFVKNTCGVQSINRMDDAETPLQKHVRQTMFRYFNLYALGDTSASPMPPIGGFNPPDDMQQIAAWAKALMRYPVGTCDAMSCLALVFLAEKKNTFPVTQMAFRGDADHVFVVLGTGIDRSASWRTWDSDTAAICDPWADYAGPCTPTSLQTWMQKLENICEPPFEPEDVFSNAYSVSSRSAWGYRLIP